MRDGAGGVTDNLASAGAPSSRGAPLASLVDRALLDSDTCREEIQKIAVGVGPGSAAGIRSTIAFAEGWRMAWGIPITAVSSMAAIAEQARQEEFVGTAAVLLLGPGEKLYLQRFRIEPSVFVECSALALYSRETVSDHCDSEDCWISPQLEKIRDRVVDPKGIPESSRQVNVMPTASAVGSLCGRLGDEQLLPLEPLTLSTPEFVKAPPPRTVPDV